MVSKLFDQLWAGGDFVGEGGGGGDYFPKRGDWWLVVGH